jgi:hypothetical protein
LTFPPCHCILSQGFGCIYLPLAFREVIS